MNSARACVVGFLSFVLTLAWAPPVSAGPVAADAAFQGGIQAYQAGDYREALRQFLRARQQGLASEQLRYNLGVTYYRLGDYAHSREEFELLAQEPGPAPLAHYNLGLIALQTGERERARSEFAIAWRTTAKPGLHRLAAQQLRSLDRPAGASSRASGVVSLAGGYDSNVVYASDTSLVAPSQRGSALVSLLADGRYRLAGDASRSLLLTGAYYGVGYPQQSSFSLNYLRAGPEMRARWGETYARLGLTAGYLTLGSNSFETLGTFTAVIGRRFGGSKDLAASYQYDHIRGGPNYGYLGGWRQRLGLRYAWNLGSADLAAGYRLELNRRNDLSRPPEFLSASPTRHRLFAAVGWPLSPRLRARAVGEYQRSRYRDANQMTQGGALVSILRQDRLASAQLSLSYELSPGWSLAGEYRLLDNRSNVSRYQYRSNRVELSLQYLFGGAPAY